MSKGVHITELPWHIGQQGDSGPPYGVPASRSATTPSLMMPAFRYDQVRLMIKLMSGTMVKAFVCGNKNDAADARAIRMGGAATRHQAGGR